MTDPFAHIVDESPPAGPELRIDLLDDTRRAYAKVRKTAIQKPRTSSTRPSMLPGLVRGGRALDLWLLTLALEPVLSETDPLPVEAWAMLIGGQVPVSASTVSRAISTLKRLNLIEHRIISRQVFIRPKMEDGSDGAYFRPGGSTESGPGFFTIPHQYWTTGLCDRLTLPGKVALLIGLAETTQQPSFDVPTTRAQEWYGISERTLERGYLELSRENLLLVREQTVRAPRSKARSLTTTVYHRALDDCYSMAARHKAQAKAGKDVTKAAKAEARKTLE